MYIDNTNYAANLKESTNPRGSTPNGNVYFNTASGKIQLIGVDELATVDFGSGPVANPLTNFDGISMRALYNFENDRRRNNETLRKYKRGVQGSYRYAGAYNFINGIKLDSTDRAKIRGSGFIEYAASGDGATAIDRVYHGVLSLVDIQNSSVPYYALVTDTAETTLQSASWTTFVRVGDINEVVQVFGTTANGDSGAGSFDYRTRILVVRVRTWGYNPGETTSVASGVTEFSGFSGGYGVGESLNPSNPYTLGNVFGGSRIAPWTGMSLEKLATPQVVSGFNETNGNFTWVLHNTGGGSAQQCAAYLDALALQNADIDAGTGTYNGKNGRVWYSRNASGKIVTASISGAGLFIENLSFVEQQNVIFTDNASATKTYPFFPTCQINVGSVAPTDPNCWYRVMYVDGAGTNDFNTANAVTVTDAYAVAVNGLVSAAAVGGIISFAYGYDINTQASLAAGVDKQMVVLVEGDGIASQAITYFTMTRSTIVPVTCAPTADNNA